MIVANDLWKKFKLSKKQMKEMGSEYSDGVVNAVAGISFTCQPGRIFTLLGPNGAGKTTVLRLIATLIKPTSGTITVAGFDSIKQASQVRCKIGFLTGTTQLYERLTPNELIKYYADLHSIDKSIFEKRKEKLFSLLDIHSFANRRIGKLSSGMKQKVSIVRTVIHDPEIIVFDEPTRGLDVISSKSIIEFIRNCKKEGKTIIYSTHIMGEVSLISDDLAIIHKGKLLYNGSYDDFRKRMPGKSLEDKFIQILEEVEP